MSISNTSLTTHIYFDAVTTNTTSSPILATYSGLLNQAIIDTPSEWYLTVIRFDLPGQAIPIFYFQQMKYLASMTYNGQTFSAYLVPPSTNTGTIYSYQEFLDIVNTAYSTVFTNLKATYPNAPPTTPPTFYWDPVNQLINMFCQNTYDVTQAGAPTISIQMNTFLYTYFIGFYELYNPSDPNTIYTLIVEQNPITLYDSTSTPPILRISNEYTSIYYWNQLMSIILTSGTLPIQSEIMPIGSNTSQINGINIVTDFQPINTNNLRSDFQFQYQPSGPYRLICMNGSSPIRIVDLKFQWMDNQQNIYDVLIPPGMTMSIKLLFVRRSFYQGNVDSRLK